MSDEEKFDTENEETQIDNEQTDETSEDINTSSPHFTHKISESGDSITHHLSGMFRTWFLDYASYVNLDRAVPDIYDGLKPVQRRILHSMREKEDGRYNKVANLVGHTMQYHPHGDASIKDALVQLGQKNFLIDKQGNWGNIMTGDDAAAGRYIEARLSKFALETVFSHKITEWKLSYDGRNKEPVTLPVKFPLLLAQGTEGIGVGLNSKILPHNFNELIDASIAYLRDEKFTLFPDFITGGSIDIAKYNNGERGGSVKIRAKIEKLDSKTLVIREIPYGTTVPDIIKSIIKANDSGKIKIRKVDDITAAHVEILIHLAPGVSSDKTIDALYAFTSCESSVSPNCCVIQERKPRFISVNELLQISTERTKDLLRQELEIQQDELREQYFFISLEKIFIENRIYKDSEFEQSESQELVVAHIYKRLEPFTSNFIRPVTDDDIFKLLEIRMKRITKYDSTKADETLIAIEKKLEDILFNLTNLTEYAIQWFTTLKDKYGKDYPRRTEIRNFESIEATKVIEATEKLYVNYEEGFIGTGLKKDEFVCNCSEIDDIIVFFRDGKYKIVKVTDKLFVGKNILHLNVYKKNDKRTIYNAVYRDGKSGVYYMKRFAVTGVSRDKEYDLTQKKAGSKVMYFSENPNGEAEIIRVLLKPKSRLLKLNFDRNFVDIAIKGRDSRGNILTKNEIQKISLRQKGGSTLGGRKVWFDPDVLRLNYDGRGELLGEFQNDDLILVLTTNGTFYTTNFELTNHYEKEAFTVEKFDPEKVWTVALYNAEEKHHYLKRFTLEPSAKPQSFLGDNSESTMDGISTADFPRFEIVFGESDSYRQPLIVDAESFIAVKSFNAKGKRLTTFQVKEIKELEPLRFAEPEDLPDETTNEEIINDEELPDENQIARTVRTISASVPQNLDDINPDEEGQLKLF